MSKTYGYIDPIFDEGGSLLGTQEHILSEEEILKEYWEYWSKQMKEQNRPESEITKEHCIDDWVVVNWATELKEKE